MSSYGAKGTRTPNLNNRLQRTAAKPERPSVPGENREVMRITSMMGDCNASALMPRRKSSIAVQSPRFLDPI